MKTKHTPGPWRIGDAGLTIFGPKTGNPSPKTVARIPKVSAPCKASEIDENIANARLIETAPELLEVLQALMEFWDNGSPVHPGAEIVADARITIQKAIGRD